MQVPKNTIHLLTLLSAVLAIPTVAQGSTDADDDLTEWCGTVATEEWLEQDLHIAARAEEDAKEMRKRQSSSIVVDTYFHVVANSTRVRDGWLTVSLPIIP